MSPSLLGALRATAVQVKRWVDNEWATRKVNDPLFPTGPLFRVKTPFGDYYLPEDRHLESSQRAVASTMRRGELCSPHLTRVTLEKTRPGNIVYDIGARFGQRALLLNAATTSKGQVFAFEANRESFALLRRNCSFRPSPVRAFHRRLGDGTCGTYRLDDVTPSTLPDIICFDVHQVEVLRGARLTIQRARPILILTGSEALEDECSQLVGELNYKLERIDGLIVLEPAAPREHVTPKRQASSRLPGSGLAEFLRSRLDADAATRFLHEQGYVSHSLQCKDWDLARIIPEIGDGNLLDMGSSDSYILKNIELKRTDGELFGIDLRAPDVAVPGVRYLVGDLMNVPVKNGYFDYVTCLSVVEHDVDFRKLAREAARLLAEDGRFFLTFDYWEPSVTPSRKLYGLKWQPLDAAALRTLLDECEQAGLELVQEMNWELGEPVINEGYFSPEEGVRYTFGLITLTKRSKPSDP